MIFIERDNEGGGFCVEMYGIEGGTMTTPGTDNGLEYPRQLSKVNLIQNIINPDNQIINNHHYNHEVKPN